MQRGLWRQYPSSDRFWVFRWWERSFLINNCSFLQASLCQWPQDCTDTKYILSAQNSSQTLTIILFSLLGKRRKMAFKLDVEPLPELQYKTLNQSFFIQLPPTPQAPTTIKLVVANWAEWIICSFIFVRGFFSSLSFHYLSTSRLTFLTFFFFFFPKHVL